MWIFVTIIGIVALVAVIWASAVSRRPAPPDPHAQPAVADPEQGELPEPGTDDVARRPDGSLMPGSEEYRHLDGQS